MIYEIIVRGCVNIFKYKGFVIFNQKSITKYSIFIQQLIALNKTVFPLEILNHKLQISYLMLSL